MTACRWQEIQLLAASCKLQARALTRLLNPQQNQRPRFRPRLRRAQLNRYRSRPPNLRLNSQWNPRRLLNQLLNQLLNRSPQPNRPKASKLTASRTQRCLRPQLYDWKIRHLSAQCTIRFRHRRNRIAGSARSPESKLAPARVRMGSRKCATQRLSTRGGTWYGVRNNYSTIGSHFW